MTNRVKAPNSVQMFLLTYETNLEGVPRDLAFWGGHEAHRNYTILKCRHESEAVAFNVLITYQV